MPTGVGAGKAEIVSYRVWGFPELPLIFLKFGHRGEYGKVRYIYIFVIQFMSTMSGLHIQAPYRYCLTHLESDKWMVEQALCCWTSRGVSLQAQRCEQTRQCCKIISVGFKFDLPCLQTHTHKNMQTRTHALKRTHTHTHAKSNAHTRTYLKAQQHKLCGLWRQ